MCFPSVRTGFKSTSRRVDALFLNRRSPTLDIKGLQAFRAMAAVSQEADWLAANQEYPFIEIPDSLRLADRALLPYCETAHVANARIRSTSIVRMFLRLS